MSGASGVSSVISSVTDAADKTSKNVLAGFKAIGDSRHMDEQLGIQRDRLRMDERSSAIMDMLNRQQYRENEEKSKWQRDFKLALARGV